MDNETKTMTPADTYRAARKDGKSVKTAIYATIDAHRTDALSGSDIMDLCVLVETGKAPLPTEHWQHEDGSPTKAAIDWHNGCDAEHNEQ